MVRIEQDAKELMWGIKTFQQCVPEKYRTSVEILIAKYYSEHPSDETIRKIVSILETGKKTSVSKEIEERVKFVKEEF